jgi:hypothetical protein
MKPAVQIDGREAQFGAEASSHPKALFVLTVCARG